MTTLRWLCAPLLVSCLAACGGPFFSCGAGPDPCITGNEPSCVHPQPDLLVSPDLSEAPTDLLAAFGPDMASGQDVNDLAEADGSLSH